MEEHYPGRERSKCSSVEALVPFRSANQPPQHYNHIAHTELEKDRAEYKRWVESHSVEEIEAANKARRSLRRRLKDKPTQVKKYKAIKDERGVKRPISSFAHFSISRHASGDFKHIPVPESGKLMSQEWKALSEGERQVCSWLIRLHPTHLIVSMS